MTNKEDQLLVTQFEHFLLNRKSCHEHSFPYIDFPLPFVVSWYFFCFATVKRNNSPVTTFTIRRARISVTMFTIRRAIFRAHTLSVSERKIKFLQKKKIRISLQCEYAQFGHQRKEIFLLKLWTSLNKMIFEICIYSKSETKLIKKTLAKSRPENVSQKVQFL